MARRAGGAGRRPASRDRASTAGPHQPSQRQLRVAEQVRHLIAEDLLQGAIHDPRLEAASITVAEVKISPDLKHAVIFATELGRPLSATTQAALGDAAPELAGRLARRMHLKYAPRLRFVADETFAEAARIERLIADDLAALEARRGDPGQPDVPGPDGPKPATSRLDDADG